MLSQINNTKLKLLPYQPEIILSILFGFIISLAVKEIITPILLFAKDFAGRNLFIQICLMCLYTFLFTILTFILFNLVEQSLFHGSNQRINLKEIVAKQYGHIFMYITILLLLINPLNYAIHFLTFPYPLEYREVTIISSALDFSRGINLYSLQNYPDHIYLYGVLYPLILAPFVNLVAHPLMVARGLNIIFLILLLGMSYFIFRKRNASAISSLIGILILFNSICFIWRLNGARPDVVGLLFAFMGFCFLLNGEPDTIHIIFCAASCVVSFYFKQYMIFSSIVIAAYLWLFISKQKGYLFIGATAVLGVGSFLIIRNFLPLFYEYSILHHLTNAGNSEAHMELQTITFLRMYWVLCFLYLFSLYKKISSFHLRRNKEIHVSLINLKKPFIQGLSIDPFDLGVLISILLLTFSLGKHVGNNYTYYGELLLPFLLYLVIPKIDELFKHNLRRNLVQVLILGFCVFQLSGNYNTDFASYRNGYLALTQYADRCTNIYDATPLAAMYKIEHKMFPLYNNGQIGYMTTVIPDTGTVFAKISAIPAESFYQRLNQWNTGIKSNIQNKNFDCIFSDQDIKFENYKMAGKIDNILDWYTIYFQVPRQ